MCRKLFFLTCFIFVLGLATTVAEAADPDLIAWWACDEGAGNVVGDISGNGHDGTFVDGDPAWVEGVRGSAVELIAPTLIEIPPLNMELTEATMAGWIKPDGSQTDWSSFIMTRGVATGFNILGYQLAYHWNDTSDSWGYRGGDMIAQDDWTFAAVTIEPDKATFYVNGVAGSVNRITHGPSTWNANIYLGGDFTYTDGTRRMSGALDDVSLFSRALTADEIKIIMEGMGNYPYSSKPIPANGAMHKDTWASISWKAGDFAVSHDVYFGDNFDDVNNGTGDTFQGNQSLNNSYFVVGFPGFPYPDGLVNGTTYYWRIDEVNDADPNSPWKGDVWSFTVPPKTAYSPNPADEATFVALDAQLKWTAGFGSKLHYVVFGEDFDEVNNAAMGTPSGMTNYNPGPLKLAKAYYWRVDEFDGFATHKGDVWSFTTLGAVSGPNPANGAVDVKPSVILRWDAGAVAASHEVYFGADADAVKNATTASPEYKGPKALGEESYNPGKLALNTAYYWRIDEVNASPDSPWAGNVWGFTTGDFFVIDDFEDYNAGDNQIWYAWHDGLGYGAFGTPDFFGGNGTGAAVGDETTDSYTEETIVNGGNQSMPIVYDNNKQGYSKYSEVELTLTNQRDWTEGGVANLSLWFRGNPASTGSFTEGPVGTYTITGSGEDIWDVGPAAGEFHDEFHFAYKTLSGPGSIVARIESVENTNAWAKAGVMIRSTLDGDSVHAMMVVSATSGVSFQRRPEIGGVSAADTTAGLVAPYWVKIERTLAGNFIAYSSANGSTWQTLGVAEPIQMSSNVYIGLAVTSHDAAQTCQAVFSNVTTTGSVGAQWANQDIGILSNDAEPLYVAVSNSAGAPAIVVHDDPAAAQINEWTEWIIPLQALADQGITLTNVDKIAIGLGTQGNTTIPGGSGKMYIDDIRLTPPAPEPEL
jgi:hypothetical protein